MSKTASLWMAAALVALAAAPSAAQDPSPDKVKALVQQAMAQVQGTTPQQVPPVVQPPGGPVVDLTADEAVAPPPEAEGPCVETVRTERPGSRSHLGAVMGTLAYMPPEQASGRVDLVDERADVFSLGAILCEILTGRPPYAPEEGAVFVQAREGRTAPALERLRSSGGPADLVDLCARCLSTMRPRSSPAIWPCAFL